MRQTLRVLVPKPETAAARTIRQGSGVVTAADPETSALALVYFEGNVYDAENMRGFEDRVFQAAGRLVQRYPTVAMGGWPWEEFEVVGEYSFEMPGWTARSLAVTNPTALGSWLEDEA